MGQACCPAVLLTGRPFRWRVPNSDQHAVFGHSARLRSCSTPCLVYHVHGPFSAASSWGPCQQLSRSPRRRHSVIFPCPPLLLLSPETLVEGSWHMTCLLEPMLAVVNELVPVHVCNKFIRHDRFHYLVCRPLR